ncbi:MAG: sugar ABC transporter permease [Nitrospinota bacterium]|nr:MAG: sugar ABC transporter permease [Nitrospinota bacterium]
MILPTLLLVCVFTLYPYAYALWSSFRITSPLLPPAFAGWANYEAVLTSPYFVGAVRNTLIFTLLSVPLVLIVGVAVASLLNEKFWGVGLLKATVLLPWAIPAAISGVIWKWVFLDGWGALNAILYTTGVISHYIPWLTTPRLAMLAVIVAQVWTQFPLAAVLTLAAMQAIPEELYEAAAIDGANRWQRFRRITLPLITPMLVIVVLFETLMSLTTFDLTYSLTGGGPGTSTTLISYFIWAESFKMLNFGNGTALAIIIALFSLLLIFGLLKTIPNDAILEERP